MSTEQSAEADIRGVSVSLIQKDSGTPFPSLAAGQTGATTDGNDLWAELGAVEPLIPPDGAKFYYKNSPSLRSNIDALVGNVHGYGWQPEPAIDFDAEDLHNQIAVALYSDRKRAWVSAGEKADEKPDWPTDDEIMATEKEWRREALIEKTEMRLHFRNACLETSFDDLRKAMATDREVGGKGVLEIIRTNGMTGPPRRYIHVDASTVSYLKKSDVVDTEAWEWTSDVTFRKVPAKRRFHLLVQATDGLDKRYFRMLGDPRVVSSKSGEVYDTVAALKTKEPDAEPANELLIFKIYFPGTIDGVPRYTGASSEIKGQYLASEANVEYLENNGIPRLMMLVQDGHVGKKSRVALRKYFSTKKGKHHTMAIVQATKPREGRSYGPGSPVKIEIVDLSKSQRRDFMFGQYDTRADEKVGRQFRMPKQFRGDTSDINKATSQVAIQSTEDQLFVPERKSFDWVINSLILPELGVRFWRFKSRGPTHHDPEVLIKILEILGKLGVLVPAEMRPVAERLLDMDLLRVAGEWQQLPISLTMQGFKPGTARPALPEGDAAAGQADATDDDLVSPPDQEPPQADVLKELVEAIQDLEDSDVDPRVVQIFKDALPGDRAAIEALFALNGDGHECAEPVTPSR